MRHSVLKAIGIPALALAAASSARADNLYTFDSPQFFSGETTPIGPTAPNSGDSTFTTSFAGPADPGGAGIISGGLPDTLFSGAFLVTANAGALTLTFNKPVFGLSVDFGLDTSVSDPSAFLELVTASGAVDQLNQSAGGAAFADGILQFTTATAFTAATLDGFSAPGTEVLFAIDNLNLTVPEPSSLALLGSGLGGLMALVLRRREKGVV